MWPCGTVLYLGVSAWGALGCSCCSIFATAVCALKGKLLCCMLVQAL
jgi:hypothetical protein